MSPTRHLKKARAAWQQGSNYDKFMFGVALCCLVALSAYFIWHHYFFSPDQFFVVALLLALALGRAKRFLWDWLPLMLLLFGYEYIRGLVPLINSHVHVHLMIYFDQFFFGQVPTITLQSLFYTPGHPHWYDYAAVCLYLMHFIVPMIVAFIFWLYDRPLFKKYAAGMVILSYITYLTYLVYPAAPPWMASAAGFLPPITKITDVTLAHFGGTLTLPTIYRYFGANLVAAVPSLHAAYPLLTALFVGKKMPKLIPLMALYALSVWVAVIYLGEHYAFDVVLGIIYALAAFAAVAYWPAIKIHWRKFRRQPAKQAVA